MKKLILALVILGWTYPSVSFSYVHAKIEKDRNGGYTEQQRDHIQRNLSDMHKQKGGYYNGAYHSKSQHAKKHKKHKKK